MYYANILDLTGFDDFLKPLRFDKQIDFALPPADLIIYIHGTFSQPARMDGIRTRLEKEIPSADHISIQWSGRNSEAERISMSRKLGRFLDDCYLHNVRVLIVGHSHGGTIAVDACKRTLLAPALIAVFVPYIVRTKRSAIAPLMAVAASVIGAVGWAFFAIALLFRTYETWRPLASLIALILGRLGDGIVGALLGFLFIGPFYYLVSWTTQWRKAYFENLRRVDDHNEKGRVKGPVLSSSSWTDEAVAGLVFAYAGQFIASLAITFVGVKYLVGFLFSVLPDALHQALGDSIGIEKLLSTEIPIAAVGVAIILLAGIIFEFLASLITGFLRFLAYGKGTFYAGKYLRYSVSSLKRHTTGESEFESLRFLYPSSFWKVSFLDHLRFEFVHCALGDSTVLEKISVFSRGYFRANSEVDPGLEPRSTAG